MLRIRITKYYEFLLIQFFFYYRRSAVNAIARFWCSCYQMVFKYNILQGREEVSSCPKCISTIWDCLNVLYDDVWKIWCASPGLVPTSSTFNAVVPIVQIPNWNPNKRQHILIIIICVYTHTSFSHFYLQYYAVFFFISSCVLLIVYCIRKWILTAILNFETT